MLSTLYHSLGRKENFRLLASQENTAGSTVYCSKVNAGALEYMDKKERQPKAGMIAINIKLLCAAFFPVCFVDVEVIYEKQGKFRLRNIQDLSWTECFALPMSCDRFQQYGPFNIRRGGRF